MTYSVEIDREVAWHKCSSEAQVMFTDEGNAIVYEKEDGLISARSKNPMFEFQVSGQNSSLLCDHLAEYESSWGYRVYQSPTDMYMICQGYLILPYCALNILQHYQSEDFDMDINNFYADDYYKICGQTLMHKFMYYPEKLEKMLDCYWQQRPVLITQVLIRNQESREITSSKEEMIPESMLTTGMNYFSKSKM